MLHAEQKLASHERLTESSWLGRFLFLGPKRGGTGVVEGVFQGCFEHLEHDG